MGFMGTSDTIVADSPGRAVHRHSNGAWTAIILAGSREETDPLAAHFGLPLKALVPVGGYPMLGRVARTLLGCPPIAQVLIVTQKPELLACPELRWLAETPRVAMAGSPHGIAMSVQELAGSEAAPWPLFITTADHPLLTPEMVEHFLRESGPFDCSIGVVERELLSACYPTNRRTWMRFRAGEYTGANLFTVSTPRTHAGLEALAKAEGNRKNQLKLLWHFGPALALGAVTKALSLAQAVERGARRFGVRATAVAMPFAEAGIDVDRIEDRQLVESILADRRAADDADPIHEVSVFDLDRTLTRRGTYTSFLLHAAWRRSPWRLLLAPVAAFHFLRHVSGGATRKQLKERLQQVFLGPKAARDEIAGVARSFARRLPIHSAARRKIEQDRAEGRRVVIATAANAFYVEHIAHELGVEEIVSTQSVWEDGQLMPRIAGENCHGRDKLAMLEAYFEQQGLPRESLHVRFFSDHPSDEPVLRWADEAYVVNPGRRFRDQALAAGWPVLSWS
jgi:HAD superfamily hydrolase (TIGR01490 family)